MEARPDAMFTGAWLQPSSADVLQRGITAGWVCHLEDRLAITPLAEQHARNDACGVCRSLAVFFDRSVSLVADDEDAG